MCRLHGLHTGRVQGLLSLPVLDARSTQVFKWLAAVAVAVIGLPLGLLLFAVAEATDTRASTSITAGPSVLALNGIPPAYLTLYKSAAQTCPGLPWAILAGIGKVESDHGRSTAPGVHSG